MNLNLSKFNFAKLLLFFGLLFSIFLGNLIEFLFTIVILSISLISVYLIWYNSGSIEIYKIVWPIIGAMAVAGYLGFEKIWLEKPEKKDKGVFVGIPEYSDGYIIPILEILNSYPSQYSKFDWMNKLNIRWQRVFVQDRPPGKKSISDEEFLDFFEMVFWHLFSERYGLGWIFEDQHGQDYMGYPHSGEWKISGDKLYKFQLLPEILKQERKNKFVNLADDNLQIGLPKGSQVTYESLPNKRILTIRSRYSEILIQLTGGAAHPLNEQFYPLSSKLISFGQKFYQGFDNKRLQGRLFAIRIYQKPNLLKRFSPEAQRELRFFDEVFGHINKNLSWNEFLNVAEPYLASVK